MQELLLSMIDMSLIDAKILEWKNKSFMEMELLPAKVKLMEKQFLLFHKILQFLEDL
jgi:hypothetical protein